MDINNIPYLIIGGTTKAATTSVFNYLSGHPQIAKSKYKEMRFFLGDDYPLEKKVPYGSLKEYIKNFENYSIGKTYLEATPDYLYSISSLDRMIETLPNFKLIFILRDPVTRLQSWYNFAKQNNSILENVALKDYFLMQKNNTAEKQQHLMALEQGFYSNYLKAYLDKLGKEKVCVIFYENIASDPKQQLQKISNFAGIDEAYFNNFLFEVSNKTIELKSPEIHAKIKSSKKRIKQLFANNDLIRKLLRKSFRLIEPLYLSFNKKRPTQSPIEKETINTIKKYYEKEKQNIYLLTGETPPWD